MSDRIGIKIDKTNGKLTITIPPAYKWKSHDSRFWITVIPYLIFSLVNIWFGLFLGTLGQVYTLCYFLLFICDRNSAVVIQYIQLTLYIMFLFDLAFESGTSLAIVLSVLSFTDIFILSGFKNSVFREIIGTTYISIEPPKLFESSKLYIYKRVLFMYQTDFVCKITGDERTPKIIEILFNKLPWMTYRSIMQLNEVGLRSRGNPAIPYYLCWLFTEKEKEHLVQKLIAEYERS